MHINLRTRIFFIALHIIDTIKLIPVPVSLTKEPCPWMKMESMTHDGRYRTVHRV